MARKPRPALELVSQIGALGFDLQHHEPEAIAQAVKVLRTVNGAMFDWIVKVLAAFPHAEAPPTPEQIAWLVGLGSMPPQWWTGRGDEFTTEIDGTRLNPAKCAMRFARREDAERAIGWLIKEG